MRGPVLGGGPAGGRLLLPHLQAAGPTHKELFKHLAEIHGKELVHENPFPFFLETKNKSETLEN